MNTENVQDTPAPSDVSTESANVNESTTQDTATTTPKTATQVIAAAKAAQETSVQAPKADAAATTPPPPAFVPNFKYKAALQDKELDPFWHPFIKDADSEKKIKEIHTRAEAFDYMKDKLHETSGKYDSLSTDFETQARVVQKVMNGVKTKDYDTVMRNLGITDHDIIQYAARKVDYLQMMQGLPPEQRQALEAQQQAVFQKQDYEEQLAQMQEQIQSQASQAVEVQLDMALTRPEMNAAVGFWDNKMGYNGAFRDLVVEEAQKVAYQEQKTLSVEQAIARVMQKFGKFIDVQNGTPQTFQNTQTNSQQVVTPAQAKPIIPAVPGAAKSPIKKQVKTMADIKKRIKELDALEESTL